ncbi:MAG: response regulator [Chloroflexi bacterium]|nr:response regulator [Chloroflexota bacterium]
MPKVLIVDDEEGVLALLTATLGSDARYELLLAKDGEQALGIARLFKPDLVFLDILMPNKDGYQVCRELKADPSTASIRVIMLTAMAQDSDKRKALEAGAEEYFTKPFSPTVLLERVERMLKRE